MMDAYQKAYRLQVLVIGLIVFLLIMTAGFAGLILWQAAQRQHDRAEARAAFSHSDLTICQGLNSIRSSLRDKENENYKHRFRNLRLLHIEASPEILALVKQQHDRELARFAATDCSQLPSQ